MFKKNWMVYWCGMGATMTEKFRTFEAAKEYAAKLKKAGIGSGLFIKNTKGQVWLVK